MLEIIEASAPDHIEAAKELFLEYAAWMEFSGCFQGFNEELAGLPGKYGKPEGRLYLAKYNHEYAGCVAFRKIEDGICEMKRLYVKPYFRGHNIGKVLVETIINDAKKEGYSKMRLDTISGKMDNAIELYKSLGFRQIEKYYDNDDSHSVFMELNLAENR